MDERILPVTAEQARVLCRVIRDDQLLKDTREEYERGKLAHHGRRECLPVRESGEDFAQVEAFIPPRFYWTRRRKYGRELFTTDAGMKDLKKHHPEFFPKTVSGKTTVSGIGVPPVARRGQTGRMPVPLRRRVYFAPGTLSLAR